MAILEANMKYDFQPYAVFNYMIKRNAVDSLPAINDSYMTVIPEDKNDLLNLLPREFLGCREERGYRTEPSSLPELRRQSL